MAQATTLSIILLKQKRKAIRFALVLQIITLVKKKIKINTVNFFIGPEYHVSKKKDKEKPSGLLQALTYVSSG